MNPHIVQVFHDLQADHARRKTLWTHVAYIACILALVVYGVSTTRSADALLLSYNAQDIQLRQFFAHVDTLEKRNTVLQSRLDMYMRFNTLQDVNRTEAIFAAYQPAIPQFAREDIQSIDLGQAHTGTIGGQNVTLIPTRMVLRAPAALMSDIIASLQSKRKYSSPYVIKQILVSHADAPDVRVADITMDIIAKYDPEIGSDSIVPNPPSEPMPTPPPQASPRQPTSQVFYSDP